MFFDWEYFSDLIMSGSWSDVDKYLSCFLKLDVDSERNSIRIYYEIRKQMYLEALIKYLYTKRKEEEKPLSFYSFMNFKT